MEKRKNKPGAGRPPKDWPPAKVNLLKKLYPIFDNEIVAMRLGKTIPAIRSKAHILGLKKKDWTESEMKWLMDNAHLTYAQMGAKLSKTYWQVRNKYQELIAINNQNKVVN